MYTTRYSGNVKSWYKLFILTGHYNIRTILTVQQTRRHCKLFCVHAHKNVKLKSLSRVRQQENCNNKYKQMKSSLNKRAKFTVSKRVLNINYNFIQGHLGEIFMVGEGGVNLRNTSFKI